MARQDGRNRGAVDQRVRRQSRLHRPDRCCLSSALLRSRASHIQRAADRGGCPPIGTYCNRSTSKLPPDRVLTSECNAEAYTHRLDGLLTWHWQYNGQVPVFPAVYGGRIQMFGRAYRGGPSKDLALRMKAGQQLVFGEQIGWIAPSVTQESANAAFLKQIVQLRWRLRRYFYAGEMARPPQPTAPPPQVTADWQWSGEWPVTTDALLTGAWTLPRENRLVLLLVNVRRRGNRHGDQDRWQLVRVVWIDPATFAAAGRSAGRRRHPDQQPILAPAAIGSAIRRCLGIMEHDLCLRFHALWAASSAARIQDLKRRFLRVFDRYTRRVTRHSGDRCRQPWRREWTARHPAAAGAGLPNPPKRRQRSTTLLPRLCQRSWWGHVEKTGKLGAGGVSMGAQPVVCLGWQFQVATANLFRGGKRGGYCDCSHRRFGKVHRLQFADWRMVQSNTTNQDVRKLPVASHPGASLGMIPRQPFVLNLNQVLFFFVGEVKNRQIVFLPLHEQDRERDILKKSACERLSLSTWGHLGTEGACEDGALNGILPELHRVKSD